MSERPVYLGIDLGTTNSTAAIFDGETIHLVRNQQGSSLTPSIVRFDARGNGSIGEKARRFLDTDPQNTRAEFKRLMGTATLIEFPSSKKIKKPEELAAEILRSIRSDVKEQFGFVPDQVVISVPALFELPQSNATTEAAKLAGFTHVELIQEPIASALAAGFTQNNHLGYWLVYDLGGGTFDVSLLRTEDGFLRVVGHDGDNFLGGKDFDWAIVNFILERLAQEKNVLIHRSDEHYANALRILKHAAEEAKIELSRQHYVPITIPEWIIYEGQPVDIDFVLDRSLAQKLFAPFIERSIEVCQRLCENHKIAKGQLERIVFVGGPTLMTSLRDQVAEELQSPIADSLDPMTLVAQGAALYAASSGLEAKSKANSTEKSSNSTYKLWLQYPAMSSDTTPHIVGRLTAGFVGPAPISIRFIRQDEQWQSQEIPIGPEGGFVGTVELLPRKPNTFRLEGKLPNGQNITFDPPSIQLVQGLTLGDPPLSRTVGVALADNIVQVYLERGSPLPARRTFTHYTIESVSKNDQNAFALKIPIVQGEYDQAHLCRLVGTIEISSAQLSDHLKAGSPIEITISIDRGGRLSAQALIPKLNQIFEQVAHLLVPEATAETLSANLSSLSNRVADLRTDAFRRGDTKSIESLGWVEKTLRDIQIDVAAAKGGDPDAGQKARRSLLELDAKLEEVETEKRWPELEQNAREWMATTLSIVSQFGTQQEKKILEETGQAIDIARAKRQPIDLQRHLRVIHRLYNAAFSRAPGAWEYRFETACADVGQASDLVRARALVEEGKRAIALGDTPKLQKIVRDLWKLLPADAEDRRLSFESGVR